jgi:hypothetical protein
MTTAPDFRALLADDVYAASFQSLGQYRTALLKALATPPGPPKNCWLDDEPDLCPSQCVFDDPSEVISNCDYARTIKCKTDCKYYRVVAPPPEPPTDDELSDLWTIYDGIVDLRDFVIVARAVLERWGNH